MFHNRALGARALSVNIGINHNRAGPLPVVLSISRCLSSLRHPIPARLTQKPDGIKQGDWYFFNNYYCIQKRACVIASAMPSSGIEVNVAEIICNSSRKIRACVYLCVFVCVCSRLIDVYTGSTATLFFLQHPTSNLTQSVTVTVLCYRAARHRRRFSSNPDNQPPLPPLALGLCWVRMQIERIALNNNGHPHSGAGVYSHRRRACAQEMLQTKRNDRQKECGTNIDFEPF